MAIVLAMVVAFLARALWSIFGMPGGTLVGDLILEFLSFLAGGLVALELAPRVAGETQRAKAKKWSAFGLVIFVGLSGILGLVSGYEHMGSRWLAVGGFVGGFLGTIAATYETIRERA
jgi:hypothetical protein